MSNPLTLDTISFRPIKGEIHRNTKDGGSLLVNGFVPCSIVNPGKAVWIKNVVKWRIFRTFFLNFFLLFLSFSRASLYSSNQQPFSSHGPEQPGSNLILAGWLLQYVSIMELFLCRCHHHFSQVPFPWLHNRCIFQLMGSCTGTGSWKLCPNCCCFCITTGRWVRGKDRGGRRSSSSVNMASSC